MLVILNNVSVTLSQIMVILINFRFSNYSFSVPSLDVYTNKVSLKYQFEWLFDIHYETIKFKIPPL